jgi:hypothetical protein
MAFLQVDHKGKIEQVSLGDDLATYLIEHDGRLERLTQDDEFKTAQASLQRTLRGWVLIDYTGYWTSVNGLRIADCKEVHEGDVIQIGRAEAKFAEISQGKVDSDLSTSEKVCYLCYGKFEDGEDVLYCTRCGTPHHVECWLPAPGAHDDEKVSNAHDQVRDVLCANCGKPYRINLELHRLKDQDQADEQEMTECPHGEAHPIKRKSQSGTS